VRTETRSCCVLFINYILRNKVVLDHKIIHCYCYEALECLTWQKQHTNVPVQILHVVDSTSYKISKLCLSTPVVRGHVGGQLVEALRYKPEDRGFDSRSCHWNFSLTIIPAALWSWDRLSLQQKWVPQIFSGGKGGRCVRLTTLSPSRADSPEIWEPQTPGTLRACPVL
jgi:hypothetical protein